jgi:hypothetical protein
MTHKRNILPDSLLTSEALTSTLIGIGFRFSGKPTRDCNIEDTLIAASLEGLAGDGRVLSLLVDWWEIHHSRVNADRFMRLVDHYAHEAVPSFIVFWTAQVQRFKSDTRFARLLKKAPKKRFNFLGERTDFLTTKNGEDERFAKTCLRIPQKVFRHRAEDIMTPTELAKMHTPYRYRILMGPSYRADMWALLSREPNLNPAELARPCYGSYPTAFAVKRDFKIAGLDLLLCVGKRPRATERFCR